MVDISSRTPIMWRHRETVSGLIETTEPATTNQAIQGSRSFSILQCWTWLRPTKVSSKHSSRRSDKDQDWTLSSEASLTWIYGAAGAGKSSIARSIAEWCQKERILLASFFFFRSDPQRNNIRRFIATLAYDIIQSVPLADSRHFIEHAVESDPHIFSRSLDAQILYLIPKPLSQVKMTFQFTPNRKSETNSCL